MKILLVFVVPSLIISILGIRDGLKFFDPVDRSAYKNVEGPACYVHCMREISTITLCNSTVEYSTNSITNPDLDKTFCDQYFETDKFKITYIHDDDEYNSIVALSINGISMLSQEEYEAENRSNYMFGLIVGGVFSVFTLLFIYLSFLTSKRNQTSPENFYQKKSSRKIPKKASNE